MGKAFSFNCRTGVFCILLAGLLLAGPAVCLADDTVCARVKIEIKQELTLERQAFDAHMRINNGLANISLEAVNIEVSFTDEDGAPVLTSSDPCQKTG
ncbi:Flagellar hook-length control protein FliK [Olavius sp. associated proteobacterium Delta 1]|nr:Flagellar hook-length control protein FliK [Olavius sp. associated proteobacterium Delta 1]